MITEMMRLSRGLIITTLSLMLFSCASTQPLPPLPEGVPPEFPLEFYNQAVQRGEQVERVNSKHSLITIYAYRGGPLAEAGHDHVIASHDVRGFILITKDPTESLADVYFSVASLRVDEANLRADAGFTKKITPQEAQDTRRNMLRHVLQATTYPSVVMHISGFHGASPQVTLSARLSLHGKTREIAIPAHLQIDPKEIQVTGEFQIRQTDFNITPFSILGGALSVKDELRIRFQLYAGS